MRTECKRSVKYLYDARCRKLASSTRVFLNTIAMMISPKTNNISVSIIDRASSPPGCPELECEEAEIYEQYFRCP
jgi:hypothetical protein